MKIHILYRHYNIEGSDLKSRPEWFDYEKCFKNLISTIQNKNVDLHLIMDGDATKNFVYKYKEHYTLHTIKAGRDQASFNQTWEIARTLDIQEKDLVYFLENDYLHVENWVEKIVELFSTFENLSYVSLYDHNDKYFYPMYENLVSKVFTTKTHHWRSVPNTCGSFIISKNIFTEDFNDHNTNYGGVGGDFHKFIHLTQTKNRFVLTPIPGLSTHCMQGLLSPCIDWEQINNQ